jgi:hypothetical protein
LADEIGRAALAERPARELRLLGILQSVELSAIGALRAGTELVVHDASNLHAELRTVRKLIE